jgi:hypothetical protein
MLAPVKRDPDLLTVSQASARLRGIITTPTLKRWALQGRIPGSLIVPLTGTVIIPRASVDSLIAPIPTQSPPKARPKRGGFPTKRHQTAEAVHTNGVAAAPKA